ncbi:hypothetical protein J6590_057960 [Homalodisca vitripennis]|nr:hypothetical protein J6590_057960 [Homalodisca vitripennis]
MVIINSSVFLIVPSDWRDRTIREASVFNVRENDECFVQASRFNNITISGTVTCCYKDRYPCDFDLVQVPNLVSLAGVRVVRHGAKAANNQLIYKC